MKISVVIPSFNRSGLLHRALSSLAAQRDRPDEIIVVDDGSTDGTRAMLRREFPEVRYVRQEHQGVSAARNHGIRRAACDWIALLDSDDEWHPDKLALQRCALAADPAMLLCHTNEIWIRSGRRVNPMRKHNKHGGWIYRRCLPLCALSPSSTVIHRSLFDTLGMFDESLPACEDYDLWLRFCAQHPVLYLKRALVYKHGGHPDQLSRRHWGMDRFRVRALEKMLQGTPRLTEADFQATLATLVEKLRILVQGARKRNNDVLLRELEPKLGRYQRQLSAYGGRAA